MRKGTCPQCSKWTVKDANYCHHCAHSLRIGFETSLAVKSSDGPINGLSGDVWQARAAAIVLIWIVLLSGVWFVGYGYEIVLILTLLAILAPYLWRMILDVLGRIPRQADGAVTLKVETVSEDKTRWTFTDLPPSITMTHLQHVAEICLPPPRGRGQAFSRRKVHKTGVLSYGDFEALRDCWLDANLAFYRDPAAPSVGIVLTEGCRRMLRKTLDLDAVGGGGRDR